MNQAHDIDEAQMQQVQMELTRILSGLKHEIPIFLFTQVGKNDVFNDAARQALRFFRQLTDKIVLREFDLTHDKAKQMGIDHSPTLVFDPDRYNVRWLGAPLGEEGRIFLEVLLRIGTGKSDLNEAAMAVLKKIDQPRQVKVFVSASCPYCPQQALNALKAAVARPEMVSLEIIDIQANADLADQYGAHSVPQTFANDVLTAMGAQTEELFMTSLDKMAQQTIFIPESDAEEVECQLVIIGGGPAGLTAGIYAARSGLKSVVVEKGVLGGQVALTPVVENYPGMKEVGGKTLVDIMVTHALEYVQIFPGEEVVDIIPGEPHIVQTSRAGFAIQGFTLPPAVRNDDQIPRTPHFGPYSQWPAARYHPFHYSFGPVQHQGDDHRCHLQPGCGSPVHAAGPVSRMGGLAEPIQRCHHRHFYRKDRLRHHRHGHRLVSFHLAAGQPGGGHHPPGLPGCLFHDQPYYAGCG